MVDEVGRGIPDAYTEWLAALAEELRTPASARVRRAAKARRLAAERVPLDVYEMREAGRDEPGHLRRPVRLRGGPAGVRDQGQAGRHARPAALRCRFGAPDDARLAVPIGRSRTGGAPPSVRPAVPISA
jgi:putative two-component system hydrogenase maturation factor HypX/HoxX